MHTGQWDAGNSWSMEGCPEGNCLRSHVNLTETNLALAMITKAGVPTNQIFVGEASYGRSFKMAEADCTDSMCRFTGDSQHSNAQKGVCTDTAGYISQAEIMEIIDIGDNSDYRTDLFSDDDGDYLVYNSRLISFLRQDQNTDAAQKRSGWLT